jgi:hypothetical protein
LRYCIGQSSVSVGTYREGFGECSFDTFAVIGIRAQLSAFVLPRTNFALGKICFTLIIGFAAKARTDQRKLLGNVLKGENHPFLNGCVGAALVAGLDFGRRQVTPLEFENDRVTANVAV